MHVFEWKMLFLYMYDKNFKIIVSTDYFSLPPFGNGNVLNAGT